MATYPVTASFLPAHGLEAVDRLAYQLKTRTIPYRVAELAAGNCKADVIFSARADMIAADATLAKVAGIPGIVQYAKDQKNDQNLDIAAAYTSMRTAIQAVTTWIEANFPTYSGQGGTWLLAYEWDANKTDFAQREFTPAQTAGLRTVLTAVADTITLG